MQKRGVNGFSGVGGDEVENDDWPITRVFDAKWVLREEGCRISWDGSTSFGDAPVVLRGYMLHATIILVPSLPGIVYVLLTPHP
ncbi:hypothetical protein CEXT_167371 [Caerostris extrusa]|uniref:Uncharacterized protein n=1 Tax=Caerostris extrusa TaxID=172846 RepID=A0AAV4W5S4_CAEEX|nr:hypothetical protein CEXT_167371 [Caerostris extrusa]